MARIPRYQESGALSSSIPTTNLPTLATQSSLQQGIGASLDKLAQFAFGEAKERQDKENKLLAIQLRADLEADVAQEIEKLDIEVTSGRLSDPETLQNRLKSLQGNAAFLYKYDANQAAGLMQSITTQGKALLNKSTKLITDTYGVQRDRVTDQALRSISRSYENAWQTMEPEELNLFLDRNEKIINGLALQNRSSYNKYMGPNGEFDKMANNARNNVMAQYFMSPDFAATGTVTEAINKLNTDQAGRYTQYWQRMGIDERKAVFDMIEQRTAMIKKGIDFQYTNANLQADPIIRKIINSNDPAEQTRLYGELSQLPLDPNKLRPIREYINSDQSGAATDDIRVLIDLTSKAARGALSVDELVSNRNRLTKATTKSIALQIANPNDAMNESNRMFDLTVGIQNANLPPEIPSAEGRAAAVSAVNNAKLELIKFRNTPDEKGMFPNDAMIRQKANELNDGLKGSMAPIFDKVAVESKNTAAMFIPELTGVDLMDDAAVNAAFAAAMGRKKPPKAEDISSARSAVTRYRENIKKGGGGAR
jgi:hypothetical protein